MLTSASFSVTVSLLLLLFHVVYSFDLEEGDPCSFDDGSKGVCKFLTSCPATYALLQQGIFSNTNICGFEGTQSIVCCKDETITKPTTSSTRKPTTTTPKPTPAPTTKPTTQPTRPKPTPTKPAEHKPHRVPGEISNQKCKEYAQYAYDRSESPTLGIISHFANTLECPYEKLELIVGGTLASRQEFPHMALLGYDTSEGVEWACGGSLISENYVLTAAHCAKSKIGSPKYIKLGITNQTDTAHLQQLTVSDVLSYSEYVSSSKYHDIALLKLSEEAELNTYVRPACLQTEKHIPFNRSIASGWGKIEYSGPGSNDLLKVVLEFFSVTKCNSTYKRDINAPDSYIKHGILDDFMICAGSQKDFKDTCQGDSGGPLQVYYDTDDIKCMYKVVGVTSFGKSCGLAKNVPGVYARVSAYVGWIENVVWP